MEQQKISVRTQKIKKDYSRVRLILFAVLALALLLVALFAQWICPHDPNAQDLQRTLQPPSREFFAGTDRFGRDMFSRILMGLQTSILSTLLLVLVICVIGTIIGIASGYWGGLLDTVLMRISDVCLAFPGLVFALAIAALLNGGLINAILALAVISWPKYARIARSQTLAIKGMPYLWAARQTGANAFQVIWRHVLPNAVGPILVTAMLDIGTMLMELAGLSFLGLGAQPPTAELGSMMSGGRSMLQTYPWLILGPGLAIFVSVVVFNLLGDSVRDVLDPRSRKK